MKSLFPWSLGLLLMIISIGCATLPVPTEESTTWASQQWPGTTLSSLQEGRKLYADTCASCHNLHLPSEFPPEKWERIMLRMQPKARIDDQTKDLILHYLIVASSQEPGK